MAVACVATKQTAALFAFLGVEAHTVEDAASARSTLAHLLSEGPEHYEAVFLEEAVAGPSLELIRSAQETAGLIVGIFPGPLDDGSLGEDLIREVSRWAIGVEM
jgi:vacuolar-type H+-ATPase subunit F/Vma7